MGNTIFADMVSAQYGETVHKLENLESKNRALMEELGREVTKLKINFVTLKSKEQIDINRCCDAFFSEFQQMDDKREKLKELDKQTKEELFNVDQKHWASQHHENLRNVVNDFQKVFITLKKETEEKIINIQK